MFKNIKKAISQPHESKKLNLVTSEKSGNFSEVIKNVFGIKYSRCDCIEGKKIIEEQWKKYKNDNTVLIDVRSVQEFEEGHINGAISIPYYELNSRIEREVKDKKKRIILYCNTGSRSKKAAKILQKKNYINVIHCKNL